MQTLRWRLRASAGICYELAPRGIRSTQPPVDAAGGGRPPRADRPFG